MAGSQFFQKFGGNNELHPRPYMSFVGNAPVIEKHGKFPKENNEKREAIRKRAQELAEQRKQRKAYSTPLYTSLNERKQNMKTRVQSSRAHSSLPVSPIEQKEKAPSPKQVWQAEEKPKLQTVQETKPEPIPVKKEISITLVSPQPDEEDKDLGDEKDKLSERKVSFTDENKTIAKPKKKKDEEDSENGNSGQLTDKEEEMRLEEKRLIESLEKQRQLQMLEQQKLLAEEQRKEKERKEKERLAEEERLRKMKESHNMHKQPLSTQNQNRDNYYEHTMNAAGLLFSQHKTVTGTVDKSRTNNKLKSEEQSVKTDSKVESKKVTKHSSEIKNNLKNSKIRENSLSNEEKVVKTPKISEKAKIKNNQSKSGDSKKLQSVNETNANSPVKIMDGLKTIEEGLEREDTSDSVKVTQGKKRKGKGKTQTKQTKVEKSPRKPTKIEEEKVSEEKLPITKPSETEPVVEEVVVKPKSPASERRQSILEQREVVKKERRDGRKCVKKVEEEEKKELPQPVIEVKKVESWIYEKDDYSEKPDTEKNTSEKLQVETQPLPSLSADLNPEFIEKEKQERKEKRRKSVLANLIGTDKAARKWRKPGALDSSYADELRRLELAEERRKKQMEMFDRLKNRKMSVLGEAFDDGSPRFEDYGFLAKYCIFTKGNIEMYRHAFDAVDEAKTGWLEGEDVMIALRGVNNRLTEAEEEYLYRVLELTGYRLTHGADFKVFSVLAALSQRISALDKWMKNLIGQMDFKALEMKMFKCRTLWECNVDKDTNSMSIDQLCVDLRAGGVSFEHEMEVREKLAHLHALDLLDFLTYIPLFIMIHESVILNPLDDTRNK